MVNVKSGLYDDQDNCTCIKGPASIAQSLTACFHLILMMHSPYSVVKFTIPSCTVKQN